jgi:hypothetical protein
MGTKENDDLRVLKRSAPRREQSRNRERALIGLSEPVMPLRNAGLATHRIRLFQGSQHPRFPGAFFMSAAPYPDQQRPHAVAGEARDAARRSTLPHLESGRVLQARSGSVFLNPVA